MPPGVETARRRQLLDDVPWVPASIAIGLCLAAVWALWDVSTLEGRLLRDGLLFLSVPLAVATAAGRDIGFAVDRRALEATVALTAFVLPIYVVGSSLPGVRAGYPMGGGTATVGEFLYRAALLGSLVVATETFYRGLLCVGIREVGPVAILVSPALYVFQHIGSVPVELLLAAPADVLFGATDYHSESILPSIVAHATGVILLEWLTMRPPVIAPDRLAEALGWLPIPV